MLSVVAVLLKLAQGLMQYLSQRQLLEAGRALEAKEGLENAIQIIADAQRIRRRQRTDGDAVDWLRPPEKRKTDD